MRIICGTDFSVYDNATSQAAGALAAKAKLPVTLVHVLDPSRYSNPSPDLMNYLRRVRQKKLQGLAERVGRRGVIVETTIVEGTPAKKLAEVAVKTQARLLVVSAVGQIAPTQWFTGSTTDQTIQLSPIPALVIRKAELFEAWLKGDRPLKVLVGFDFSESAQAAIRWAGALDAIAPCDINVVYVASQRRDRTRFSVMGASAPFYYPSALRKFLEEEIHEKCAQILGDKLNISVQSDWGRPDSQLLEMAADSRVDLVVVGTSQRRGLARLGSVSRAVVHYAKMNVASVPEGWAASQPEEVKYDGHSALARPAGIAESNECPVAN